MKNLLFVSALLAWPSVTVAEVRAPVFAVHGPSPEVVDVSEIYHCFSGELKIGLILAKFNSRITHFEGMGKSFQPAQFQAANSWLSEFQRVDAHYLTCATAGISMAFDGIGKDGKPARLEFNWIGGKLDRM